MAVTQQANPRIDPAEADGMFRRSLRETDSTALTRGLHVFGVRATAIAGGRYGQKGPIKIINVAHLGGMFIV
jgi:hypothetical protein